MASARELIVLGTAAQSPTRERSQSSYVLRWDDELISRTGRRERR